MHAVLKTNGRSTLDFCKASDFIVLNGRIGIDKHLSKFACVNAACSSVVDYILSEHTFLIFDRFFFSVDET